ncbi:MAG TPA: hypothetical protein VFP65_21170 [Anaeromyxobacteraceae bacterium]|nr:hypothetical protein [Anaeromyxobacteraceae bacterium]
MTCACSAVQRMRGLEAATYAREHLALVRSTPGERAVYRCPLDRATLWLLAANVEGPELARLDPDAARAELAG